MNLSRKEYITIADKLKDLRIPNTNDNPVAQGVNSALNAAAKELACVFSADSRFNRERFLAACGL